MGGTKCGHYQITKKDTQYSPWETWPNGKGKKGEARKPLINHQLPERNKEWGQGKKEDISQKGQ